MVPSSRLLLALCALAATGPLQPEASTVPARPPALDRGAVGLELALRRVGTTGRVLMVTAHPDDEKNGVLVHLARGRGVRAALLTVTRGEGGQNAIGPELEGALGVLRTEELMAIHRLDGVEQYFGRAYEFGYSFSVEETFARWGREETLGDVVRVVRAFRPDVILTLPLEAPGGGQHHQAVARLARDAFRAAADPRQYPEQVREGLRPWQARAIHQSGTGNAPLDLPETVVSVATGVFDPLFGMTWHQLGSLARTLHRCQGLTQLGAPPGHVEERYFPVDAVPPLAGSSTDLLDGIDTSLEGLARFAPGAGLGPRLRALQEQADAAGAAFDARAPERAAPALADALRSLRALRADLPRDVTEASARSELDERLGDEERDLVRALLLSRGVATEVRAEDGLVTPGQAFGVLVSVWNEGDRALAVERASLEAPPGWTVAAEGPRTGPVEPGSGLRWRAVVTVGAHAPPSQPYWRRRAGQDRHDLLNPAHETLPWSPPRVVASLVLDLEGVATPLDAPAVFRYPGPFVGGEKRHVVQVVPALAVRLVPEQAAVRLGSAASRLEVRAFVRHNEPGPGAATVRLDAPAGWSVEPAATALRFAYEGEEVAARFVVSPPRELAPGAVALRAVATRGGRDHAETVQEIAYDHIERRQMVRPAETKVLVLDVRTSPGAAVGYVMGSGDAVAGAIEQLGVPVTLLGADDLAFGELSRFTTIVTGVRAYDTRSDLRSSHPRLIRWVEAGGHLVVQYNRDPFNRLSPEGSAEGAGEGPSPYAPFPAVVTPRRITDENAPVSVLVPEHALLTIPNRIGPADWEGWVQERGIQLLEPRDPRYVDLLAATDPFPLNPGEKRGMLVEAKVGAGTWTYVGLVLFRQVPAGVPGGWRLLANLVSRPRGRRP